MDRLAAQVAVNSDNITHLFSELERVRGRLHTLENDRATVLLLAQKVDALAHKLDSLAVALPKAVDAAAERAAERVAEREHVGRLEDWKLVTAVVASVGVFASLAANIVLHFF